MSSAAAASTHEQSQQSTTSKPSPPAHYQSHTHTRSNSNTHANAHSHSHSKLQSNLENTTSQFPPHSKPRVWLLTSGDSPVGISLTKQLLAHGDYVVCGIDQVEFEYEHGHGKGYRGLQFKKFLTEIFTTTSSSSSYSSSKSQDADARSGWRERLKVVGLDIRYGLILLQRNVSSCQAAIASAVASFKRIDVLFCCTSQTMIGAVEEFSTSLRSQSLVREQFESNLFGPMNIIRAIIPDMRTKANGHIMVLTGIFGHIGTPGIGIFCAAGWALEGFCDSIAYEIAPFNIKLTIVQASIEIGLLTNKIVSAPPMFEYSPDSGNTAPLFRNVLDGLLNRLPEVRAQYPHSPPESSSTPASEHERQSGPFLLSQEKVVSLYPPLGQAHSDQLVAETVHALTAIGGHENPPARHIVGLEGVASVKEKLKTVSEELEEFVDASVAVDVKPSQKRRRSVGIMEETINKDVPSGSVHPDVYDAAMVFNTL